MNNTEQTREECNALLAAMLGNSLAQDMWWRAPNKHFCGDTPEQIFSVSPRLVLNYLWKCAEGEW